MENKQKRIRKYIDERNWSILNRPDWIAKSISIESAELLEAFQFEDRSKEDILKDKELLEYIKNETADVLMYCLEMAESLGFSLEDAWEQKFERVKKKYPATIMKDNPDDYYKIKNEHRK